MSNYLLTLGNQISWQNYLQLTKPRVVSLIVFTAAVGMVIAAVITSVNPGLKTLLAAVIGIGLAAAGAAVGNCVIEYQIDAKMTRTQSRATASGQVSPLAATSFSLVLVGAGLALLQLQVNTLTAFLTLATFIGYVIVYTIWLKPATPQNIVIGGASGAMPPVLGWTAVTGQISHEPLLLFLIVFVWTPPHFWALALYRLNDYRKACVPMLPVTHGAAFTRLQILLYSIVLVAVSVLPFVVGMSGVLYLGFSLLSGAWFIWLSWRVWKDANDRSARALFNYSSYYLLAVFAAILLDSLIIGS